MKHTTIENLIKDLNKDKEKEQGFEKNNDFVYEIEMLPVLTKRDKNGRLEEVTQPSNGLLFKCEND